MLARRPAASLVYIEWGGLPVSLLAILDSARAPAVLYWIEHCASLAIEIRQGPPPDPNGAGLQLYLDS